MTTLSSNLTLPCGVKLSNRIAKSAMSEQLGDRYNQPTEELVRLYRRWADGGAGLLITGNIMIDQRALGEPRNVTLEDDRKLELFSRWAAAGRAQGNHIWVQINHPGRQSPRYLSPQPVAPSAVSMKMPGNVFIKPRALEDTEIKDIINRFARTAGLVKQAGFTGVQIHGAHGYLVNQFLSPLSNLRTDQWGGSLENRRRFLKEILYSMRETVGSDFPIGIKLNSADFQRGGFSQEESMVVVEKLAAEGIDLLEISGGTYESAAMIGEAKAQKEQKESTRAREAYFLEYAQQVRKLVSTPIMLTGGFRTVTTMQNVIAAGDVDVIGMARPLTVEPDLPAQLINGKTQISKTVPHPIGIAALDSFVELMWHTQQMHRIGAGLEPDPGRSSWFTLAVAILENGWDSFRLKRGSY